MNYIVNGRETTAYKTIMYLRSVLGVNLDFDFSRRIDGVLLERKTGEGGEARFLIDGKDVIKADFEKALGGCVYREVNSIIKRLNDGERIVISQRYVFKAAR